MATQPGMLSRLMTSVSKPELSLIERTLASAMINRLRGTTTSLTEIYEANGGSDPTTQSVLKTLDSVWHSVDLAKVTEALGETATEA